MLTNILIFVMKVGPDYLKCDNMKTTIATKTITSGIMAILRVQSSDLLQFGDTDSTSLTDSSTISTMIAKTPYSGRPTGVIIDRTPVDILLAVVVDVTILVSMTSPFVFMCSSY